MSGFFDPLYKTPEFKELEKGWREGKRRQLVYGLTSSFRNYVMSALAGCGREAALVVTPGEKEAAEIAADLKSLLDIPVYHFPLLELLPFQVLAQNREVLTKRLKVLSAICGEGKKVVVASTEALMRRLCPRGVFCTAGVNLAVGDRVDLRFLLENIVNMGYERVEMVESVGQVCLRGGILDVFTPTLDKPVRIEFFDDEVDSIRPFDAASQRSTGKLQQVEIGPALELVVTKEGWERGKETILNQYQVQLRRLTGKDTEAAGQLRENMQEVLESLDQGSFFPGIEQYLPYFYAQAANLIDYLPEGALVLVDEPQRVKSICESIQKERAETFSQLVVKGKALPSQYEGYLDWKHLELSLAKKPVVYFSFLPRHIHFIRPQAIINFTAKAMHNFMGKLDMLADDITRWRRAGYAVLILTSSEERGRDLLAELRGRDLDVHYAGARECVVKPGNVTVTRGFLSRGFELINAKLAVITEKDIYGRPARARKRERARRAERDASRRVEPFVDLKVGDYVVHTNHGIGKYMGVVPLEIGGVRKEYLLVKYSGGDKLYVPSDQVGLLQKYLGAEGEAPRLSRLGGSEWSKAKSRVKQAVREIADDLIKLYAARETARGHAFSPDTPWQQEFEASFPYEETPDQLKAIEDVKRDMESPRPMDRLICGDVGYGKTEVALRAAFKAVMDGKQVAVLVPTTILAQQHYNTFQERYAGYPVRIEMLSRFRTPKEQRQVIEDLAAGKVDIVIGTHRLVQGDVKFKDLGLLVVDEEQRFGVAHKEKLKQMRTNVDVLTLTATPIPRTLHMSLIGVRDTSILETPPENRYPVQTYVLEEDPVLIREAIRRETGRGGQVYFVHNRVMDLDRVAAWLHELVPEARLAVAHGQMKEDELEQVMLDFMDGMYDVLVCTSIIENGLDIPNVNTLIVKEADNFGLAQLYQLRGRVGRSTRVAYAYFTFRRDKVMGELAEKRLAAIREFTEFGSGYRIAMRDLEIRGAGNLLGAEQHGHIAAVGFDMYCRLLEEAVREAKGEEVQRPVDTVVELPVEAFIPDQYIPDTNQKVEVYRRIAAAGGEEELAELEEELTDRFGDPPEPVQNLVEVARLKNLAGRLKIKNIGKQHAYYKFLFAGGHPLTGEKLVQLGKSYPGRLKFHDGEEGFEIRLKVRDTGLPPAELLERLRNFLFQLA